MLQPRISVKDRVKSINSQHAEASLNLARPDLNILSPSRLPRKVTLPVSSPSPNPSATVELQAGTSQRHGISPSESIKRRGDAFIQNGGQRVYGPARRPITELEAGVSLRPQTPRELPTAEPPLEPTELQRPPQERHIVDIYADQDFHEAFGRRQTQKFAHPAAHGEHLPESHGAALDARLQAAIGLHIGGTHPHHPEHHDQLGSSPGKPCPHHEHEPSDRAPLVTVDVGRQQRAEPIEAEPPLVTVDMARQRPELFETRPPSTRESGPYAPSLDARILLQPHSQPRYDQGPYEEQERQSQIVPDHGLSRQVNPQPAIQVELGNPRRTSVPLRRETSISRGSILDAKVDLPLLQANAIVDERVQPPRELGQTGGQRPPEAEANVDARLELANSLAPLADRLPLVDADAPLVDAFDSRHAIRPPREAASVQVELGSDADRYRERDSLPQPWRNELEAPATMLNVNVRDALPLQQVAERLPQFDANMGLSTPFASELNVRDPRSREIANAQVELAADLGRATQYAARPPQRRVELEARDESVNGRIEAEEPINQLAGQLPHMDVGARLNVPLDSRPSVHEQERPEAQVRMVLPGSVDDRMARYNNAPAQQRSEPIGPDLGIGARIELPVGAPLERFEPEQTSRLPGRYGESRALEVDAGLDLPLSAPTRTYAPSAAPLAAEVELGRDRRRTSVNRSSETRESPFLRATAGGEPLRSARTIRRGASRSSAHPALEASVRLSELVDNERQRPEEPPLYQLRDQPQDWRQQERKSRGERDVEVGVRALDPDTTVQARLGDISLDRVQDVLQSAQRPRDDQCLDVSLRLSGPELSGRDYEQSARSRRDEVLANTAIRIGSPDVPYQYSQQPELQRRDDQILDASVRTPALDSIAREVQPTPRAFREERLLDVGVRIPSAEILERELLQPEQRLQHDQLLEASIRTPDPVSPARYATDIRVSDRFQGDLRNGFHPRTDQSVDAREYISAPDILVGAQPADLTRGQAQDVRLLGQGLRRERPLDASLQIQSPEVPTRQIDDPLSRYAAIAGRPSDLGLRVDLGAEGYRQRYHEASPDNRPISASISRPPVNARVEAGLHEVPLAASREDVELALGRREFRRPEPLADSTDGRPRRASRELIDRSSVLTPDRYRLAEEVAVRSPLSTTARVDLDLSDAPVQHHQSQDVLEERLSFDRRELRVSENSRYHESKQELRPERIQLRSRTPSRGIGASPMISVALPLSTDSRGEMDVSHQFAQQPAHNDYITHADGHATQQGTTNISLDVIRAILAANCEHRQTLASCIVCLPSAVRQIPAEGGSVENVGALADVSAILPGCVTANIGTELEERCEPGEESSQVRRLEAEADLEGEAPPHRSGRRPYKRRHRSGALGHPEHCQQVLEKEDSDKVLEHDTEASGKSATSLVTSGGSKTCHTCLEIHAVDEACKIPEPPRLHPSCIHTGRCQELFSNYAGVQALQNARPQSQFVLAGGAPSFRSCSHVQAIPALVPTVSFKAHGCADATQCLVCLPHIATSALPGSPSLQFGEPSGEPAFDPTGHLQDVGLLPQASLPTTVPSGPQPQTKPGVQHAAEIPAGRLAEPQSHPRHAHPSRQTHESGPRRVRWEECGPLKATRKHGTDSVVVTGGRVPETEISISPDDKDIYHTEQLSIPGLGQLQVSPAALESLLDRLPEQVAADMITQASRRSGGDDTAEKESVIVEVPASLTASVAIPYDRVQRLCESPRPIGFHQRSEVAEETPSARDRVQRPSLQDALSLFMPSAEIEKPMLEEAAVQVRLAEQVRLDIEDQRATGKARITDEKHNDCRCEAQERADRCCAIAADLEEQNRGLRESLQSMLDASDEQQVEVRRTVAGLTRGLRQSVRGSVEEATLVDRLIEQIESSAKIGWGLDFNRLLAMTSEEAKAEQERRAEAFSPPEPLKPSPLDTNRRPSVPSRRASYYSEAQEDANRQREDRPCGVHLSLPNGEERWFRECHITIQPWQECRRTTRQYQSSGSEAVHQIIRSYTSHGSRQSDSSRRQSRQERYC